MAMNVETERWEAVLTRAPGQETSFVYAVRTTGVFCRPGCASRRPLRKNVEFFDEAADAMRSGYRPCRRCQPMGAEPLARMLERACALLESDASARTRDVAQSLEVSPSYFQRVFKRHLGVTPQQYRRRALAEAGRVALRRYGSVTESVYAAGYSSSSRFYDGVGRELGMTPSEALHGGHDHCVRYVTSPCSLGHVLIAWTARGICEVALGEDTDELSNHLVTHFPASSLEPSEPSKWTRAVIEAVEHGSHVDLPRDVRGTAFQERVWQALRSIPRGETRTYADLAASLGVPAGSRAVARACAANRLAVLVPCHRVIRKDGGIAGYRWGMERKQELLERERREVEKH